MNIQIVLQGKIKDKKTVDLIAEYRKRLQHATPLEIVEWGAANAEKEERFFRNMKPTETAIGLDGCGKVLDSIEFAKFIGDRILQYRTLYMFVGEAAGLSETVKKYTKEYISLSPLTFSYEVALIVLAEQLYRSMTIRAGHPYHK